MATAPQSRTPKFAPNSPAAMEVEWVTNDLVALTQASCTRFDLKDGPCLADFVHVLHHVIN